MQDSQDNSVQSTLTTSRATAKVKYQALIGLCHVLHRESPFQYSSNRIRRAHKRSLLTCTPLARPIKAVHIDVFTTYPNDQIRNVALNDSTQLSARNHTTDPRPHGRAPPYSRTQISTPRSPVSQQHRREDDNLHQSYSRLARPSTSHQLSQNRLYQLEIVQHPLKTAEFGSSTLTRLPLAPPLIAQLHIRGQATTTETDLDTDLPFLIAHLSLYSADGTTPVDITAGSDTSAPERLLYGNLVSSPHVFRNLQGRQGVYFLFPDVSIRWKGRYQLCVSLMKLPGSDPTGTLNLEGQGIILTQAHSLPFDVLSRREYVAPVQTPLTQYFLQQGARMTTPLLRRSQIAVA